MKKLVVAVFAVLFVAPAVMANDWGLAVKLGGAQNDPKSLKEAYNHFGGDSKELDKNAGYIGLEVLYEWNLDETIKSVLN